MLGLLRSTVFSTEEELCRVQNLVRHMRRPRCVPTYFTVLHNFITNNGDTEGSSEKYVTIPITTNDVNATTTTNYNYYY